MVSLQNIRWASLVVIAATTGWILAQEQPQPAPGRPMPFVPAVAENLPRIPPPDPRAVMLPRGFVAEVVMTGLTYPTSLEFDEDGNMYIAEAGYAYGDDVAIARVSRLVPEANRFRLEVLADQLNGPVTDILWHEGSMYISHRGKISMLDESGVLHDLVQGLPSLGDHHNNGLALGPDGKIYFGQGTATNSGVVGTDNFNFGWLKKYPQVSDIPARDIVLRAQTYQSPDPVAFFAQHRFQNALTLPFHPFGTAAENAAPARTTGQMATVTVPGQVKANGTILRMNPDGSGLEVFAWGLRNPFGLGFTPDGRLLCTDAGYDERGVRPIANAPDCLWEIRAGRWYGFPDYAGGIPVTAAQFRPARGPAPQFVMAQHPPVEKPLVSLPAHTGGAKFDLSRHPAFGKNQAYVALMGDMVPATGEGNPHPGYSVARLDLSTMKLEPFFSAHAQALGPAGFEYVATTGPKRPVDVKFSPQGDQLYVVDFGAVTTIPTATGPMARPFPATGTIWRITPPR